MLVRWCIEEKKKQPKTGVIIWNYFVRALPWVTPVISIRPKFRWCGRHHRIPQRACGFCKCPRYSVCLFFSPGCWAMGWRMCCLNFRATALQSFDLFWVKIPSPVLSLKGATPPTSLSSQTTTASTPLPRPVSPAAPRVYPKFCDNAHKMVTTFCF